MSLNLYFTQIKSLNLNRLKYMKAKSYNLNIYIFKYILYSHYTNIFFYINFITLLIKNLNNTHFKDNIIIIIIINKKIKCQRQNKISAESQLNKT